MHFAKEEVNGIHHSLCGLKFDTIASLTTLFSKVTCDKCKELAKTEVKANVELLFDQNPHPKHGPSPISTALNYDDLCAPEREIKQDMIEKHVYRPIEVNVGGMSFNLSYCEATKLADSLNTEIEQVDIHLDSVAKIDVIEQLAESILSTVENFRNDPEMLCDVWGDLSSDARDLDEAVHALQKLT